jgi:ubiquinone/menaquinone biosynthesis C-methylase UbiE
MLEIPTTDTFKEKVRDFWNSDPCGRRYMDGSDDLVNHATARYALEPHIPQFAQFPMASGMKVLEIGVGIGADYLEWLKAGALATGIDISASSIDRARRRCELAGYKYDLEVADAENLPFESNSFDLVYSYGVMHHSSNVQRCIDESWRVLKSGGRLRIMLYHDPSLTGLLLWMRFGIFRGKSIKQSVYEHLESPGTKAFSKREVYKMAQKFDEVVVQQVFSPGDLLLHKASPRFQGRLYRMVWLIYPRFLVRKFCRNLGLFLLVSACKP